MPFRQRLRAVSCWILTLLLIRTLPHAAVAKDTWIEVRSPHFTVITNGGEKEARTMADQFEQFREVFHTTFPKWRVDLGKSLIIFAVRNEDSLKALIPGYWEGKGRAHPAGLYMPGEERHYVAVRTDVETDNPYQIVYHEYTHAIMNLNFRELPVWLSEGLAEFYGNSVIQEKDVEIGKPSPYHLQELQTERRIPISELLMADRTSPYYNEANHATMFYAESWAIVHYLMMDPEARKQQVFTKFLTSWDANGNQLEAAEKAFGDLKKFGVLMESYARQRAFYVTKINTTIHGDPKSFTSRVLPPAEVDAQRGLFYAHTARPKEAMAAVDEAIKEDPKLPLAYEAQGFLAYSQREFLPAEASFQRAIELGTTDYFPYYFIAQAQLRNGRPTAEQAAKIIGYLGKAIQINPQFAPAYTALASVYSANPETYEKAFAAGRKAVELEPGNLTYATSYGYVLANTGKTADAKALALRIQQAAKTPEDRANAQELLSVVAVREQYDKQVAEMNRQPSEQKTVEVPATHDDRPPTSAKPTISASGNATASADAHRGESEYAVEGNISAADCASGPGKVTIAVGTSALSFRFQNMAGVEVVTTAKQDSGNAPACDAWKGRRVRIYFYKAKDKQAIGDLNTIQFF
jgi:tetratricopeptide (TPR) repeat protein